MEVPERSLTDLPAEVVCHENQGHGHHPQPLKPSPNAYERETKPCRRRRSYGNPGIMNSGRPLRVAADGSRGPSSSATRDLMPGVQNTTRKRYAQCADLPIRVQPVHQIAHMPPHLASFRFRFHPEYPVKRGAAKQQNPQNIKLDSRKYDLLVKAGICCASTTPGVPQTVFVRERSVPLVAASNALHA